ncbi:MAG TPA: TonB family protein [Steroidobacter sp.]|nr:TonB family protein [Steroidobacter sp.]
MNATGTEPSPLGADAREGSPPVNDRFTTTLFLAALFHGIVILGVTFALPDGQDRSAPTLEVLLLTAEDTRATDNPQAQYLAQRSQLGVGTTDNRVRPANPASSAAAAQQAGLPDGNSTEFQEAVSGRPAAEVLTSRADRTETDYRHGVKAPARDLQTPLALAPTSPRPIATNATDRSLRLRGRKPDGSYDVIPNTRESQLAPYLDSWRRKVERLGTSNFPQIARDRRNVDNPVLEVSIRADGSLGEVVLRRSSRRKDIDQAALTILRLAAPFDPFPAAIRKQYEELRFAYEWQFVPAEDESESPAAIRP